MKDEEFKKKIRDVCYLSKFNIDFTFQWYRYILNRLSDLSAQQSVISHPRHLGDAREHGFKELLAEILPTAFIMAKGYAINSLSTQSAELDFLSVLLS